MVSDFEGTDEARLYLAGLEKDCPALPHGDEDFMHDDCGCNCTGKVALVDAWRRECFGGVVLRVTKESTRRELHSRRGKDCLLCQGRGWLPDISLETLLAGMRELGWSGSWGATKRRQYWTFSLEGVAEQGKDAWVAAMLALKAREAAIQDGHWTKIALPNGPTSPAKCKRCGVKSDERNSLDKDTQKPWGRESLRREADATLGSIIEDRRGKA
tara:strand:- start:8090 stop:8731 length:642 start_codon:yes stop_codon:yes gene_type:complete